MAFNWKFWNRKSPTPEVRGPRRMYGSGSVYVNEDTAMKVAAFYRGLIYISTQIAKLPWETKDKSNQIVEDDLSKLLSLAPNSEMNAFSFRLQAIQNAIMHGNSYAEIERTYSGRPVAVWPIPSCDTELVRSRDGLLFYKINGSSGYGTYANIDDGYSESNSYGKTVYLPARDVFHVKNFHTKDGLVGQGLKDFAIQTLGISLAADNMASGIFNNGGVPSGILKHKGQLSDEAYKRLKDSWAEQNSGRKAGSTSILEEGVEYEAIEIDAETLQFLESRKFGVIEIARFLGLPPTKLFDTTGTTFSNIENANLEVATDTLDAWARNLESEADIKLLNNGYGGRYSELDLYAVFRGDMKTRADYFKALMGIGAITPNQVRAREGQAAYPEGNDYYIATNNLTPVDMVEKVIEAQINKGGKPSSGSEDNPEDKALKSAAVSYLTKK